ncbi:hypothetical protein AB1Y20_006752 [Prymnesium parvum]|uniref:Oxidation resistance protein 1 n=1 Tax=Prymnesium parvum TaxID=97485 RepID=A0AB34J1K5_PRYPA
MLAAGLELLALGAIGGALRKTSLGERVATNVIDAYSYVTSSPTAECTGTDGGAAQEPLRRAAPRPALRPILLPQLRVDPALTEHDDDQSLLTSLVMLQPSVLEQLAAAAPRRYGDTGSAWYLIFYTSLHGTSLAHLLRRASQVGPCFLLVTDSEGRAFGAFCSELRERSSEAFYGVGETFLCALERMLLPALPERQLSSPSPSKGSHGVVALNAFRWTRANGQFIRTDGSDLVIGSGGQYGLWLDSSLQFGMTGSSDTFDNPPLTQAATPGLVRSPPATRTPSVESIVDGALSRSVASTHIEAGDTSRSLNEASAPSLCKGVGHATTASLEQPSPSKRERFNLKSVQIDMTAASSPSAASPTSLAAAASSNDCVTPRLASTEIDPEGLLDPSLPNTSQAGSIEAAAAVHARMQRERLGFDREGARELSSSATRSLEPPGGGGSIEGEGNAIIAQSPKKAIIDESWYTADGVNRVAASPADKVTDESFSANTSKPVESFQISTVEVWAVDNFLCHTHPLCSSLVHIGPPA